jgi:hypothetical protein
MRLEIAPKCGVGPIKFGMNVDRVRALIGVTPKSFKRTPLSKHPLDYFECEGMFVNYDSAGTVEALEFDDSAELSLNGERIQGISPQGVRRLVQNAGARFQESDDSIISNDLGLRFWFPDKVEIPDAPAQSVVVFRDGYFD